MILWVFIKNFGVKIVITDIYRYVPIFYRYLPIFTDILPIFYRYFFKNSCTSARAPQSRFFGGKIGFFRFVGEKSAILPIFSRFFLWSIFPLIFLLGAGRKPIFQRNIGRKNRFFVPYFQLGYLVLHVYVEYFIHQLPRLHQLHQHRLRLHRTL